MLMITITDAIDIVRIQRSKLEWICEWAPFDHHQVHLHLCVVPRRSNELSASTWRDFASSELRIAVTRGNGDMRRLPSCARHPLAPWPKETVQILRPHFTACTCTSETVRELQRRQENQTRALPPIWAILLVLRPGARHTSGPIPHLPSSHAYGTRRYELRSHSPGHSSSVSHFCRAGMVGRVPWSQRHGPRLSRGRTCCSPRFYRCLRLHFPEVSLLYQLVVAQAARGAVQHDFAGLQYVAIVGDRKRHVRILLHHEDGGALLVDRLDDLEHLLDEGRR